MVHGLSLPLAPGQHDGRTPDRVPSKAVRAVATSPPRRTSPAPFSTSHRSATPALHTHTHNRREELAKKRQFIQHNMSFLNNHLSFANDGRAATAPLGSNPASEARAASPAPLLQPRAPLARTKVRLNSSFDLACGKQHGTKRTHTHTRTHTRAHTHTPLRTHRRPPRRRARNGSPRPPGGRSVPLRVWLVSLAGAVT